MLLQNNKDFEYVVQKQEKQKICFGSGDVKQRENIYSFIKYNILEKNPNISPASYNILDSFKSIANKPSSVSVSNKGYSGIARFSEYTQHIPEYPSPCEYQLSNSYKKLKKSTDFILSTTNKKNLITETSPGPGSYEVEKEYYVPFDYSFGGKAKMKLGIAFKCCNRNVDTCSICQKKPNGDYWHFKNRKFLCRLCMSNELKNPIKYNRKGLEIFRKIRDCSEVHKHEGTNAKLWVTHPKYLIQRLRKEAYLSLYK